MNDRKEILIAKVFCGGFILDGENIGHEIIDFSIPTMAKGIYI